MRLFYAPASPFAAKVRMAAHHCGLPVEPVAVDTNADPAELLAANPLGKIPTLLLDDGTAIYDSRVIVEYLDRQSGNALIPQLSADWLRARRIEATADGVADAILLVLYETRYRAEGERSESWVARQWAKADRGLDALEREVGDLPETPDVSHFALAGLLGWLTLRFAGRWEEGRPALVQWIARFGQVFPAYDELKSRA